MCLCVVGSHSYGRYKIVADDGVRGTNELVEDGGVRPSPGAFGEKKRKKVYIPVDKYPDINFMGAYCTGPLARLVERPLRLTMLDTND